MKVKMKVKHLVTSVLAFTALLFVFILFIQPQFEIRGINQQIEAGNVKEAKNAIFEKIENDRRRQIDLIREYMIEPHTSGDRYDVYISPSMTTFGSVTTDRLFNIEESEPYLQLYIKEAPADGYFRRAIDLLHTFYKSTGQIEKAEATVKEGLTRFSKDQYAYHDLQLMKIQLAITSQNYDRAQLLIDEYEPKMNERFTDTFLQLSRIVAEMLIQQREYDQAYEYLMEEIEKHEDWHNDLLADRSDDEPTFNDGMTGSPYFHALVKLRDQLELMKDDEQLAVVKGKVVRSNGDPVANAGVYLRPEEDVSRSVIEGDRQVITGSDGSFSFIGVLPGSYQITVGFMFEQIDGWAWSVENNDWIDVKEGDIIEYPVVITPLIEQISPANDVVINDDEVTFSWEEFPGAATYELSGNIHVGHGSTGVQFLSDITESEVTIPVEHLYSLRTGTMFRGDDFTEVEPASILGFANPEGTFSWSVKAYNEDGDLIGQSNGYRLREETMGAIPFFQLKARQLTEADETFLRGDGNIEQALKMYKENVEANPDDLHSLRMITRLMAIELERDSDALAYWIALAEKANDAEAMFEVFMHHYELEKWEEANEWFERYRENIVGPIPSYSKSIYAAALMKQGKLEQAREHFYEVLNEDRSNRFVGFLLAIELYLQDDWENVEQIATQYKERGMNAPDWLTLIGELRENVTVSDVTAALAHFFSGQKGDLDEHLEKIDQRALSQFINALQNVR